MKFKKKNLNTVLFLYAYINSLISLLILPNMDVPTYIINITLVQNVFVSIYFGKTFFPFSIVSPLLFLFINTDFLTVCNSYKLFIFG